MADVAERRRSLRLQARAARAAMSAEERLAASEIICAQIVAAVEFRDASTVGVYLAMPVEVDLRLVIDEAHRVGKRVVVPRIVGDGVFEMVSLASSDFGSLVEDRYGIATPMSSAVVAPGEIDVMLVPVVAFDDAAHRIGNGKGYYDRYLRGIVDAAAACRSPRPPFLGVAFDAQRVEPFEPAAWDVTLDRVVTERA